MLNILLLQNLSNVIISHRCAKANNKYLPDYNNSDEEESFLMQSDVNNLHGDAMSGYLPIAHIYQ